MPPYFLFLASDDNITPDIPTLGQQYSHAGTDIVPTWEYYASLFLIVGVEGIVSSEVKPSALLALQSPTSDEIAHIDHIAQLADILRGLYALKETLSLLVEHVETVPGTMQTKV